MDLGNTVRTFNVADGAAPNDFRVQFPLVNGALVKTGEGTLFLEGDSAIAGVQINQGTVVAGAAAAFLAPLAPSVIEVGTGATLDVQQQFAGFNVGPANTLRVRGSVIGSLNVSGVLSGSGTVTGAVNIGAQGFLFPGPDAAVFSIGGSLFLGDDSAFHVDLGGTFPGTGPAFYDQVQMTNPLGFVAIGNNATLNVSLSNGFVPSISDFFFILTREDLADFGLPTFANAGEGDTINLGGGYSGTITYLANWTGTQAGSTLTGGNDIAIYSAVPEPGAACLLLGGLAMFAGRRSRSRRH